MDKHKLAITYGNAFIVNTASTYAHTVRDMQNIGIHVKLGIA